MKNKQDYFNGIDWIDSFEFKEQDWNFKEIHEKLLKDWLKMDEQMELEWKKYSKNKNAHNYLFPRTKFGNAISNQKYNSYIKEICKHIGLDRGVRVRDWDLNGKEENTSFIPLYSIVSSHIGRRTFIREHIELGTPIRSIMKMTGHTTQKVFDGYYNVLDKDIMKVNDGLFNQELDQKKEKKSKSITSETEEQLKTLLRLKEMGTLPEDIWKEKVKQLIS